MTTETETGVSLQPGAFYYLRDLKGTCPISDARMLTPHQVMYVRDEEISYKGLQHVFAGIWPSNSPDQNLQYSCDGILMRLRMPVNDLRQTETGLCCDELTTRLVISSKGDEIRTPSITTFIKDAKNLINDPSVRLAGDNDEEFKEFEGLLRKIIERD